MGFGPAGPAVSPWCLSCQSCSSVAAVNGCTPRAGHLQYGGQKQVVPTRVRLDAVSRYACLLRRDDAEFSGMQRLAFQGGHWRWRPLASFWPLKSRGTSRMAKGAIWSEEPNTPGGEAPCAGFGAGDRDADTDADAAAAQHHTGRGREGLRLSLPGGACPAAGHRV